MRRGTKLLLGAATLWPLLYLGLFMGYWLSLMVGLSSGRLLAQPGPPYTPGAFGVLFVLHCLTMSWLAAVALRLGREAPGASRR